MSLLQVFTQWTDVAPVLTKDQHVNYQRGLCDLFCSVMCCDPFSYTRVVLIHWTLRRPLLCSQALERGTTTGRWATSWRDRTWSRTCMNPEMTEPGPCHIWTLSHLDCVTSGQQLHRHKLFYLSRHCFTDSSCSSFSGTWSLFPALEEMIVGFSFTVFAFYLVHTLLL